MKDEFWGLVEQAKAATTIAGTQAELVDLCWSFDDAELRGDRHAGSFPAGMSEDAMGDVSLGGVSQRRAFYERILTKPARLHSSKGGP